METKNISMNKEYSAPTENLSGGEEAAKQSVLDSMLAFTNFATILRMCGALTVVAAMSAFLMQDWAIGSDVNRFYMLLSQTLLLMAGGLGLTFIVKENKGARVFLGLGLLSITINMATLGALIFSTTQWFGGLGIYPDYVTWKAVNLSDLVLPILGSIIVTLPVALFSFKVFARQSAMPMTAMFLTTNLLLLLPVRASLPVGILIVAVVIIPLILLRKLRANDASLRTPEGAFAAITILIPSLVMMGRSLWLYQADILLQTILAGLVYAALRETTRSLSKASGLRLLVEWISFAIAFVIASGITELLDPYMSYVFEPFTFGAVLLALSTELARRQGNGARTFIYIAALVAAGGQILSVLDYGTVISGLLAITLGVAVYSVAKIYEQRFPMVLGVFSVFAGFGVMFYRIIVLLDFSNWSTLAIVGAVAIIVASIIERHGVVLKLKCQSLAQKVLKPEA